MMLGAQRASCIAISVQSSFQITFSSTHVLLTIYRVNSPPPITAESSSISVFPSPNSGASERPSKNLRGQGYTSHYPYLRKRAAIIHVEGLSKGSAYLPYTDIAAWCAPRRFSFAMVGYRGGPHVICRKMGVPANEVRVGACTCGVREDSSYRECRC